MLEQMAATLTNKLIHPTTAGIREASADGRTDRLNFIQQLYGLEAAASADEANRDEQS